MAMSVIVAEKTCRHDMSLARTTKIEGALRYGYNCSKSSRNFLRRGVET
jgi:hypothetical protein